MQVQATKTMEFVARETFQAHDRPLRESCSADAALQVFGGRAYVRGGVCYLQHTSAPWPRKRALRFARARRLQQESWKIAARTMSAIATCGMGGHMHDSFGNLLSGRRLSKHGAQGSDTFTVLVPF